MQVEQTKSHDQILWVFWNLGFWCIWDQSAKRIRQPASALTLHASHTNLHVLAHEPPSQLLGLWITVPNYLLNMYL